MKIIKILIIILIFNFSIVEKLPASNFENWVKDFKTRALKEGISEGTFNLVMENVKFLPKVIEYDRYQPEFYEDTFTYISKRTNKRKVENGIKLYKKNKKFIDSIETKFNTEKELLLSLMGIETNFGTYVGKMDIISSLATLSYDERRSEFFSKELLTILKLVDKKIIDHKILFGSWAGAFGNFQFMPSTIDQYAIDYNKNNSIELKEIEDSFASAANYINKMGWRKEAPCFVKVELKNTIPDKYLNTSARKIKYKKKLKFYKKYLINFDNNIDDELLSAIITPDYDIIENSNKLKPAYIIFENYELILKWNRSLRFGLAVCTLKEKFKNEI